MGTEYSRYALETEVRTELKKAFLSNAALRLTKVKLEKQLEGIRQKLLNNEKVDAILAEVKYSKLAILQEKQFLKDIEAEVASEYQKSVKKSAHAVKTGTQQKRNRLTQDQKREILRDILKDIDEKEPLVTKLDQPLNDKGIKTQGSTFLKACGVPKTAIKAVSNARKDGNKLIIANVKWLQDRIEHKPATTKKK